MLRIIRDIIKLIKDAILFVFRIAWKLLIIAAIIAAIVFAIKNAFAFIK